MKVWVCRGGGGPRGEDSWEKPGRGVTWAGQWEAGHRRGIREEQQESRVAPSSEHSKCVASSPEKCTAGPGLAKVLLPPALTSLPAAAPIGPQKPPGPPHTEAPEPPGLCPRWEPGSEGPSCARGWRAVGAK